MTHCQDWPYCPTFCGCDFRACPVCGATGPCGYDTEGRPLVHTTVFPTAATGSEAT